MKPKSNYRLAFPLASAIAALLAGQSVHAGQNWDGGGADNNWNTAANWDGNSGGVLPNFANAITFTGNTRNGPVNNLTAATTIGGINLTNDGSANKTNAFTLLGNSITLGGNITTTANTAGSTITDTSSLDMILNGDRTITTNQQSASVQHNLTVSGIISESGTRGLIKAGGGVLTLTGANSYTGTTAINAGTLDLGGGTANGSLLSTTLTLSGGSFNYTRSGNTTQGFTTTNINVGGAGQISVVAGNTLNLGTVVRGAGGTLDFGSVGAGTVAALAANNVGGIMPGFTVGDTWAVANDAGAAISGLGSYTLTSAAGNTAANYAGLNMDVDSSQVPDAVITTNSLRFNNAGAHTLTLATGTNTISASGILLSSAVGNNLSTITGGTLTGPTSKDLAIIQNNVTNGLTISSIIADNTSTSLTKSGAGLLTLDASNTFTGGLVINGGKVLLDDAGALNSTVGSENAVTFGSGASGTLTLNGNSMILRNLATNTVTPGTAIVENANAGNVTLTVGNSGNASGTFAGVLQDGTGGGALALTKAGTGSLTLSGANAYTGGTTLTAGTVAINNATSFGAGNILVTGSSRINVAGGPTYANAINVGAPLTMQIPAATSGTATFSGQLTGSNPITVVATGVNNITGTYAFTNANNTFNGNVIMPTGTSSSTPSASGNDFFTFNSIGDGGNFTFQKSGHSNAVVYTGSSAITFNTRQIVLGPVFDLAVDGGGVNPVNSFRNNATDPDHTVTFNTHITPTTIGGSVTPAYFFFAGSNTGDNTFAGTISNTTSGKNLGIGKADGGKWILTGSNSYMGNVLIANGTLSVNAINVAANNQPLGKGSIIQLGNSNTNGTLEYTGVTSSTDKQIVLGNPGNNNQSGAGGIFNNSTTGTLTFSNATFNSITGVTVTTVDRTLTLGGSNTGANTISGIIQDHVAGAAQILLTKTGTSTWVLNGANTYTGATAINDGTLQAISGTGLPTSSILQLRGGVFQSSGTFSRVVSTAAGAVNWATGSGGFAAKGAPLVLNLNGGASSLTWNGSSMVSDGQTLIFGSTTADNLVDFQNALNLGSGAVQARTITVNDNSGSTADIARISGEISNTTAGMSLIKNGDGTLELTAANTYDGTTTIDAGTLVITGATQSTSEINFGGGILGLNISSPVTAASATVDFTGQSVLVIGSPTLASYTLLTANSITGTPALAAPAPSGYSLQVFGGNELRLVQTGGNTFATWIAGFPAVGGQNGVGDDADGDGSDNGVENFFGTNPSVSTGGLVAGAVSGSTFTFTHPQNSTPASDLTAVYQWSKDLATFNASGAADGGGTTVTFSTQLNTPVSGTTTVTATVTGTATSKLFARVKVTQP